LYDPGQPGILSRTKCASFKAALTAEGLFRKAERKLGGHRIARAEVAGEGAVRPEFLRGDCNGE
jgi:hypothetical protein